MFLHWLLVLAFIILGLMVLKSIGQSKGGAFGKRIWGFVKSSNEKGSPFDTLMRWSIRLFIFWLVIGIVYGASQKLLKDMKAWNSFVWSKEKSDFRPVTSDELEKLVDEFYLTNARAFGWSEHLPMPFVDVNGKSVFQFRKGFSYDLATMRGAWKWIGADLTHMEANREVLVHFPEQNHLAYEMYIQCSDGFQGVPLKTTKPDNLVSLYTGQANGPVRVQGVRKQLGLDTNTLEFEMTCRYEPSEVMMATEKYVSADELAIPLQWGKVPDPKLFRFDIYVALYDESWKPLDVSQAQDKGLVVVRPLESKKPLFFRKAFMDSKVNISSAVFQNADETAYLGIKLPQQATPKPVLVVVTLVVTGVHKDVKAP